MSWCYSVVCSSVKSPTPGSVNHVIDLTFIKKSIDSGKFGFMPLVFSAGIRFCFSF